MTRKILSVQQTGERFGVSDRTVRRNALELGGFYLGGRLLFTEEALDAYIQRNALDPRIRKAVAPIRRRRRKPSDGEWIESRSDEARGSDA